MTPGRTPVSTRRRLAAACVAACLAAGWTAPAAADPNVEMAAGLRALKARDYPRAIAYLTRAIDAGELAPKLLSDAHYFRGRALTRTHRPELALDDFSRAVTYWPENVKALRVRCRALTLKDSFEQAESDCDQAVLLAPGDWRSWFTRGLLRKKWGQRDLARVDMSAAQMRMPNGLESYPMVERPLSEFGLLDEEGGDGGAADWETPTYYEN